MKTKINLTCQPYYYLDSMLFNEHGFLNRINLTFKLFNGSSPDLISIYNRREKLLKMLGLKGFELITMSSTANDKGVLLKFKSDQYILYIFHDLYHPDIRIYFGCDTAAAMAQDIMNKIRRFKKKRESKKENKVSKVNLITNGAMGIDSTCRELTFDPTKINLETQYPDGFKDKAEKMISDLKIKNKCGLHLLHSKPGTGKSTLIKWIMSLSLDKKVFYLPPDMSNVITSPNFIEFMMEDAKNSILIIEDAETIIKPREQGGGDSVSNLLNITDGILGDLLNIQVICTFNTGKKNIDKALLRPGRLLNDIELGDLSAEKADALLELLGKEKQGKAMRICDIYNDNAEAVFNNKKIGF